MSYWEIIPGALIVAFLSVVAFVGFVGLIYILIYERHEPFWRHNWFCRCTDCVRYEEEHP